MTLKNSLKDFTENNPRKQLLEKDYTAFEKIAKAILNGYFEVSKGNTAVKFVKPTKVEFYYHEEYANSEDAKSEDIEKELSQLYNNTSIVENLLIKDFIVYHRNKPKHLPTESRAFKHKWIPEKPEPLFQTLGTLNNHNSGIDITFEHKITVNDKTINVRASALIRGFYVYENENDCSERRLLPDSGSKHIYPDDRSTYLYDYLYGSSSVLDGISVLWKDGEENTLKDEDIATAARTNVYQYVPSDKWQQPNAAKDDDFAIKKVKSGEPSTSRKYVPDERALQFYNKEYYK